MEYGTDKKLHVKKNSDGSAKEYIITLYQMAAKEVNIILSATMTNMMMYPIIDLTKLKI